MFGIGETELLIIIAFAFMVFGPDKLPGMGRTIGRMLRQFREAQEDITKVVQAEVVDPLNGAMNETSGKAAADRAQAIADDGDRDDGDMGEADAVSPRKKETFAERKARLQAERAKADVESLEDTQPVSSVRTSSLPSDPQQAATRGNKDLTAAMLYQMERPVGAANDENSPVSTQAQDSSSSSTNEGTGASSMGEEAKGDR